MNDNGKPLTVPSVTTVLKLEDKSALIQWAADQSILWAVDNWFLLGSRSSEDAFSAGRYAWSRVRDSRAQVGTGIHETVEAEHTGSWNFPELDPEQKQILEQWKLFNEEWIVEPVLSEFTVWSHEHDYAGTADGLWDLTNRQTGESFRSLIDIKTSRNLWPGHLMQLAALKNADVRMVKAKPDAVKNSTGTWPEGSWIEVPNEKADRVHLLQLRAPEYDKYDKVTKPAFYDLHEVTDLDLHWDKFVCYRNIWSANDELKAREKLREQSGSGF
jgi:hypothetical protein